MEQGSVVCQCRAGSGLGIVLVETGVGGVKVQQMILGRTASNMQQSENETVIRGLGIVICRDASWHGCWVDPMFKMRRLALTKARYCR